MISEITYKRRSLFWKKLFGLPTIELNQIQYNTKNWEKPKYDKDFREKLGLPSEDTENVAR
ncbi:hypothetical protein [uncultured Nostoc sp.]|uniref:hypothetical protein n=1 Tax=uncultured Nostoc sp. TaxID=340711 RepID=UPI0035CAF7F4